MGCPVGPPLAPHPTALPTLWGQPRNTQHPSLSPGPRPSDRRTLHSCLVQTELIISCHDLIIIIIIKREIIHATTHTDLTNLHWRENNPRYIKCRFLKTTCKWVYLQFPAQASYLVSPTGQANILLFSFLACILFIFSSPKRTLSEQHVNPPADQNSFFLQSILSSDGSRGPQTKPHLCPACSLSPLLHTPDLQGPRSRRKTCRAGGPPQQGTACHLLSPTRCLSPAFLQKSGIWGFRGQGEGKAKGKAMTDSGWLTPPLLASFGHGRGGDMRTRSTCDHQPPLQWLPNGNPKGESGGNS